MQGGAKVVALQKALVTLLTTIGFDFGMNRQNVFGKVVFSGELMCAHLAFELFPFLMHCKERSLCASFTFGCLFLLS